MRKTTLAIGVLLIVAAAFSMNAYADGEVISAGQGFWNSIGGFLYNALPWNWGNWFGK